jgi:AcrR family transcriptional regulator
MQLTDLISAVTSAHQDPLARLERAVVLGSQLDEVADRLIGHFVDQARRSGATWTAIGSSLGVSKQAVQKRFATKGASPLDPSQGFSRFTERARSAVVAAQEEARSAGNDRITVAHLLLGLLRDPACGAATLLAGQGVDLDAVQRTARATLPARHAEMPALVPFDAHAREVLERTFTEAERLGHDQVGTEHILMAVLVVEDGTGVLAGLGVDAGRVSRDLGKRSL